MSRRTTNKQLTELRALESSGATLNEAADAMCWSAQRVQYWEKKLGLRFERVIQMQRRTHNRHGRSKNPYADNIRRMMQRMQYIIANPMGALCS